MTDATPPAVEDDLPFPDARHDALEEAADLARHAPSVHNSQPWTLVLRRGRLALRADRSRQLSVIDPLGRALVISVGAALFNARAALAARGWAVEVARLPAEDDGDLLAELRPVVGRPDSDLASLAEVVHRRRTNRRRLGSEPVPGDVLQRLTELAQEHDTTLVPVLDAENRALVGRLTEQADRMQTADPAYRAELREWTTRDRATGDGVPAAVAPHTDGGQQDAAPFRSSAPDGTGAPAGAPGSGEEPTLVLLATRTDDPMAWLRAGEAMESLLLELVRLDWVANPVTQPIEVPLTRAHLRSALVPGAHPQLLLRIGRAAPTVATPRRPRAQVVRNSTRPAEPLPVHAPPERSGRAAAERAPRRAVPDGRGGTVWI